MPAPEDELELEELLEEELELLELEELLEEELELLELEELLEEELELLEEELEEPVTEQLPPSDQASLEYVPVPGA